MIPFFFLNEKRTHDNVKILCYSVLFLLIWQTVIVRAIQENVGGFICNTNDPDVFVIELSNSVDATLFANQPKISAGNELFAVGKTMNGIRRALLRFSTEEISGGEGFPLDARVDCAEVRLTRYGSSVDADESTTTTTETKLYQTLSSWSTTGQNVLQNGNGGKASDGDTTWEYSIYPTQRWDHLGGDFDSVLLGSEVNVDAVQYFGGTSAMSEVVQGWIEKTAPNYGFLLVGREGENDPTAYSIYHGIETSPEFIPRLIVTYTSPSMGKPHREKKKQELPFLTTFFIGFVSGGVVIGVIVTFTILLIQRRRQSSTETVANVSVTNDHTKVEHQEALRNKADLL